ncbi:MAG: 23S rRNA (guanosine2251-2'-O)-methyltransferase [Methylophagaceae bacterium]|jgi:23S rRNA (guanosine2251-2'-O)-methyltransferase
MSNPSSKAKSQTHIKRRKSQKSEKQNDSQKNFIFGLHAIQAALELPVSRITEIWLADERHDDRIEAIVSAAKKQGIHPKKVSKTELDEMMPDARHQGGVAKCNPLKEVSETDLLKLIDDLIDAGTAPLLLILDGVQDPHNLGACLRTAEAAGAHAVIAPKDRASGLTATAMKVSSGSAERLPFVQVTNLARILRELQQAGVWLVGTSGDSESTLYDVELKGPLAIILGAEGRGIRRLTRESCDQVVHIPMHGGAESLNVSVASGVCLFEVARQRGL